MKGQEPRAGSVRIRVRVQPGASRTAIVGRYGDAIKVAVAAPPVRGAANEALIVALAAALGVPARAVRVVHGHGGRDKIVEVTCADAAGCRARLVSVVDGAVDKAGSGG